MKVLIVIDSLVAAGAERSLVQTAPLLAARGVQPHVVTIHDRPGLQPALVDAGIPVEALGGNGRRRWYSKLAGRIEAIRPDLVHTTLFEAGLAGRFAARRKGVPVVSTFASEPYIPERFANPDLRAWKIRAAQATEAASLRLARRVHAVSDPVAETVAKRLAYPRARIDVINRGRDPEWLGRRTSERREAARARLGVTSEQVLSLTVARNEYIKGLDVLIDTVPLVLDKDPAALFVVAGRATPITEELKERARTNGVENAVRFLGERDDVPDLLSAADIFVLPTRNEGFPGAIVEAMAMEVPVLSTSIPTVEAVVDASTAVLVGTDSAADLTEGFFEALRGPERDARVAAARHRFETRLTLGPVADAMAEFYLRAGTPGS